MVYQRHGKSFLLLWHGVYIYLDKEREVWILSLAFGGNSNSYVFKSVAHKLSRSHHILEPIMKSQNVYKAKQCSVRCPLGFSLGRTIVTRLGHITPTIVYRADSTDPIKFNFEVFCTYLGKNTYSSVNGFSRLGIFCLALRYPYNPPFSEGEDISGSSCARNMLGRFIHCLMSTSRKG